MYEERIKGYITPPRPLSNIFILLFNIKIFQDGDQKITLVEFKTMANSK